MHPVNFPQANRKFGPPEGWDLSQCEMLPGFVGTFSGGVVDGAPVIITAWRPSPEELAQLNAGEPVFVMFIAEGLPPHYVGTKFEVNVEEAQG